MKFINFIFAPSSYRAILIRFILLGFFLIMSGAVLSYYVPSLGIAYIRPESVTKSSIWEPWAMPTFNGNFVSINNIFFALVLTAVYFYSNFKGNLPESERLLLDKKIDAFKHNYFLIIILGNLSLISFVATNFISVFLNLLRFHLMLTLYGLLFEIAFGLIYISTILLLIDIFINKFKS